ncbi:Polymerase/histidinol phosphatase-like protein [Trichophaea hybrida]|nr:Polymerase/histidinol phosphatase-like protein [Trichophaea hybrida]
MPFSHHSHSGQFCHHAKDTLEEIILTAISKGMRVIALTEHMPRDQVEDLYPEEIEAQQTTFDLFQAFATYYNTALLLRGKYGHQIHILVGFEAEYIRPSSIGIVRELQELYKFDFFIGSVHHVNSIPIDFNRELYQQARASVAPDATEDHLLFGKYFDIQYEMLTQLRPAVIGHFDLIRLMATDGGNSDLMAYGNAVWDKVIRNLEFIKSYNGLIELNSSSMRKGWSTPYPGRDVCKAFMAMRGRFTLSDDAHAAAQVGLNYHRVVEYAESLGMTELWYLEKLPMGEIAVDVLDACAVRRVGLEELRRERFWELSSA